jgi:hypothetical protein
LCRRWQGSFLVIGGTYDGGRKYNDDVYYFDSAQEKWEVWMTHRDAAREKFVAIPITRNIGICEPKSRGSRTAN